MLNSRELRIILLLQEHDLSGEELAGLLASSRRTIVRDIARINTLFSDEKIGSIESIKKYHLLILNAANFNQLLTQSNNESNLVLLNLLIYPNITMAELAERTFLSRQNVLNCIEKVNRQYQKVLKISLRPRIGISIAINHISKVDVLANLILDNQQLVTQQLKLTEATAKLAEPLAAIRQQLPEPLFNYLNEAQLNAQGLACLLISNQMVPTQHTEILNSLLKQRVPEGLARIMASFFGTKIKLLNSITVRQVQTAVAETKTQYPLDGFDQHFAEAIFRHLCRSSMFPTFVPTSLSEQISYLKIKNPFAFDFAFDLAQKLQTSFDQIQIDDEYVALYVLHAIAAPTARNVRTLMYATRQSVANINKMIIMEQIPNLDIEMVFSKEQLEAQLDYVDYNLIIGNGLHPNDLRLPVNFDSTFNGVISQDELDRLKNLSSESYIQKNLTSFFPKSHFVYLPAKAKNVQHVLQTGMDQFVKKGLLTADEVEALTTREAAGNQLVLNHVSLPHASAKLNDAYEIFAIAFDGEVEIDHKPIYLIIIVLANHQRADSGQVFGYLYSKLKQLNQVQLQNVTGYEGLVEYLGNESR